MRLSDDLLARIRERAANPELRTDDGPSMGLGDLLRAVPGASALSGLFGGAGESPLRPCRDAQIEAAEKALGFSLPEELRQLYLEIGDGGFGPGGGLFSLKELVGKWRELTREPPGPQGQAWPADLLPIEGSDWDLICLNRQSGALIFWDMDELADGYSARHWHRSFKDKAESLEAWLTRWVNKATPRRKRPRSFLGMYIGSSAYDPEMAARWEAREASIAAARARREQGAEGDTPPTD